MKNALTVRVLKLRPDQDADLPLPRYMTPHASGMDLYAAVPSPINLAPGAIERIPTGIALSIPVGYEAQIRARSGLAVKHGVGLVNALGTIDADYRGELFVPLINWGRRSFPVARGDRIAQLVFQQVCHAELEIVYELDQTTRQDGGFGHTGI